MKRIIGVAFCVLALGGCITMSDKITTIGTVDFYRIYTCDAVSPCTTTIVTHNQKDGSINKIEGGTGPSVLGQFLGPASVATAGYFIGRGLEESGDDYTDNSVVNSAAGAATVNRNVNSQAQGQGQGQGQSLF